MPVENRLDYLVYTAQAKIEWDIDPSPDRRVRAFQFDPQPRDLVLVLGHALHLQLNS